MSRHHALLAAAAAMAVAALPAAAIDLTPDQRQTVAAALTLHDFEIQTLAPEAAADGTLRVDLTLDGNPATLVLTPHSIRAAAYAVAEIAPDGTPRTVPADPVATYRGRLENDPDSRAAASFVDGRFAAWIDTGEALWMTQSLADVLPGVDPAETAVFAGDDIDMSHWFCAVDDAAAPHDGGDHGDPGLTPRGVSDCPLRLVTIEMTADNAFFSANGGFTQTRIEAMINIVSMLYEGNFATRVELIGIRINTGADPWFAPGNPVDAGTLLNAFSGYINITPPVAGNDRDFAHLASGREFVGSTVGLAGVGTVCNSTASTAVNQWTNMNLSFNAGILAHEKGHNWGAGHDGSNGCPSSGFIMSPGICSTCGPQPTQFSPCSIFEITPNNLSRSCVAQLPPTLDAFDAVNDTFIIPRGTAHLIDVLLNDLVCMNGDAVQVGSITLPSATTAAGFPITVVPGAGPGGRDMIDYAPHVNFLGTDTFTYALVNGAQSASAFVSINVSSSAAPPLCFCDCFVEYRDDSGTAGGVFFGPGVPVNWLNRFNVEAGADQVLQVTVFSNNGGGNTVRFVIWDDPNNDGQPFDAVPIATSPIVPLNANGPTSFTFPPTDVGSLGDSFFVGASFVSGSFPIDFASEPNFGDRSWLSIGGTNLGQNGQTQTTDNRLVIRAVAGADLADCNSNDIVDFCDVAGFIRPDVNGNSVPDECDPPPADCPCEFDNDAAQVDVFDLLAYLDAWFPGSAAADIDGAPGVDVFDLLSFLDCWFPASSGDPCP